MYEETKKELFAFFKKESRSFCLENNIRQEEKFELCFVSPSEIYTELDMGANIHKFDLSKPMLVQKDDPYPYVVGYLKNGKKKVFAYHRPQIIIKHLLSPSEDEEFLNTL